MTPIPVKLRAIMNADPFMKVCCLCDNEVVEWHHTIIYAGGQLNERWAIVPACDEHHRTALRELKLIALNRATDQELIAISKSTDYIKLRDRLNEGKS